MSKPKSSSPWLLVLLLGGGIVLGSCVILAAIAGIGYMMFSKQIETVQSSPPPISSNNFPPNNNNFIPAGPPLAQPEVRGPFGPNTNPSGFGPMTPPTLTFPQTRIEPEPAPAKPAAPLPLILPPLPPPLPINPSPIKQKTVFKLPADAGSVRLAGGGRFLLIHFPKLRKVGLFDTSTTKIERYVDLAEDDVRIAGSMNHLVVLLPGVGLLQRYSLLTGEREFTSKVQLNNKRIEAFCLGHSSAGPLLIVQESAGGKLYDIANFKEMPLPAAKSTWGEFTPKSFSSGNYWAGATGRVFGHSGNYGMPNGVKTWVYENGDYTLQGEHQACWYVMPGPDDQHIYVGGHGVLTPKVKPVPNVAFSGGQNSGYASHWYLPAAHGPFYLHAQTIDDSFRGVSSPPVGSIRLYMLGDKEPIKSFTDTGACNYNNWSSLGKVGLENSIQLIPKAKLMIVIPQTVNELILFPTDLEKFLEESDRSYFYVTSDLPKFFKPGEFLQHQIMVKSKKPVKFKLESGPVGMTVSDGGTLVWRVPANFEPTRADVILAMKDSDGKEAFHTFTLERNPGP